MISHYRVGESMMGVGYSYLVAVFQFLHNLLVALVWIQQLLFTRVEEDLQEGSGSYGAILLCIFFRSQMP